MLNLYSEFMNEVVNGNLWIGFKDSGLTIGYAGHEARSELPGSPCEETARMIACIVSSK